NKSDIFPFISRPPSSIDEFRRFVRWVRRERGRRRLVCYGICPKRHMGPVGIIQVWSSDSHFQTAEWGFVLDSDYWGTGLFQRAAHLVLGFAFGELGVHRLEARAVEENGRGMGALRKIGATPEGVLRGAFERDGRALNHVMWSILAEEWNERNEQ